MKTSPIAVTAERRLEYDMQYCILREAKLVETDRDSRPERYRGIEVIVLLKLILWGAAKKAKHMR